MARISRWVSGAWLALVLVLVSSGCGSTSSAQPDGSAAAGAVQPSVVPIGGDSQPAIADPVLESVTPAQAKHIQQECQSPGLPNKRTSCRAALEMVRRDPCQANCFTLSYGPADQGSNSVIQVSNPQGGGTAGGPACPKASNNECFEIPIANSVIADLPTRVLGRGLRDSMATSTPASSEPISTASPTTTPGTTPSSNPESADAATQNTTRTRTPDQAPDAGA